MNNKEYIDYIAQFNIALIQEIAFLKQEGGKKYRLFNGVCIYKNDSDCVYTFETDTELYLPDSSPIRFEFNGKSYPGEILSCEGFGITIILYEDLGKSIRIAELISEPWGLLEELKNRLEESSSDLQLNKKLAYSLICEGRRISYQPINSIRKGQEMAAQSALNDPITIIWGPPGTGKTHTLANIAINHFLRGNKVLIVSHSNIAVDQAIEEIIDQLLKKRKNDKNFIAKPGEILRYGYARSKKILKIEYVLSNKLVLKNNPDLEKKKNALEAERAVLKLKGIHGQRVFEIEKELRALRTSIRSLESCLVSKAKIVATTISKSCVDSAIYRDSEFDVVMLDEASMAYIPQACFTAGLAKKSFICFGDFRQLSPIAQSNKPMVQKWLLQDIFQHLNIIDTIDSDSHGYHPWLVLLDEQRRMHPKISGFVSNRIYHNLINDHPSMKTDRRYIEEKHPFQGEAMSMLDLTSTCNVCSRDNEGSRFNLLSAFISLQTGLYALAQGQDNVGIITPYSVQSRLIRSMINDCFIDDKNQDILACATVHQFQGSQRDVIVFDCVDSYRQVRAGVLLTGHKNNNALRLINVAVTRSRGKFIAVANRSFFNNKLPLSNSILRYLLDYIKEKGMHCSGNDVTNFLTTSTLAVRNIAWYTKNECIKPFINDIFSSRSEILMDIPIGTIIYEDELTRALETAKKRGVRISLRAEKMNAINPALSSLCRHYPFAWAPLTIIDSKIVWYGIPVLDTAFITGADRMPIKHWPVVRFEGEKTADIVISLLEMHRKSIG